MKILPWVIHYWNKALSKSLFKIWDPESWHKIMMQKLDSVEKINYILDALGEILYLEDSTLESEIWNRNLKPGGAFNRCFLLRFREHIQ